MRLTIIPSDKTVYLDGEYYNDIDMRWVPLMDGIAVHAVQWYGDHGEVELVTNAPHIKITELGVWEQAIELWQKKKEEHETWLEEQKSLMEVRDFSQYEGYGDLEDLMALDYVLDDEIIDQDDLTQDVMEKDFVTQEIEKTKDIDEAIEDQLSEEDEIYYDIEELLKEI